MNPRRTKTRIRYQFAVKIAEKVQSWLDPLSDSVVLVGSMRRKRPWIGDIEFVVLPKDLETFARAAAEQHFHAGKEHRKYVYSGPVLLPIPVELYVARRPEEMGAMTLWYTGDYLFNIAMNSMAKRMGYKKDPYGIWKGSKPVLQSPDEREFFDFLGMEYHAPEERSLARRGQLRKMVKILQARKLSRKDQELVERVAEILKTRTPLSMDVEARLISLYGLTTESLGSETLGFHPVPEEEEMEAREIVQGLYDNSVGRGGTVLYMDVNIAYSVVQVIAAVQEGGVEMIYLLMEVTDAGEEMIQDIMVDSESFLRELVDRAGRGEVEFTWQGPWRPMAE